MGEAGARLDETSLNGGDGGLVGGSMLTLTPPRIRVVVYPRVPAGC